MTDEQEREHCERVAKHWSRSLGLELGDVEFLSDDLLRERAEADQAGYERGRAEQSEHTAAALELGDKAGYERGRAEAIKDIAFELECRKAQVAQYDVAVFDLHTLQAKYDRLAAAARAYLKAKNSAGANEVLARETELIAALKYTYCEYGKKISWWLAFMQGLSVRLDRPMKSPGQAAREAYENEVGEWRLTNPPSPAWEAIAQAAIEAFRAEALAPLEAKIEELRYALHETESILVVEGLICDEERFDYE